MSGKIYRIIGASNHTDKERQGEDFYASSPWAIDRLRSAFRIPHNVWEPSAGMGHLSKRLLDFGHHVVSTDLVDRGFCEGGRDFRLETGIPFQGAELDDCCILTNPPFSLHMDFIEHALLLLPEGQPAVFLLRSLAIEGKERYERFYRHGYLHCVYQFRDRLLCAKNGDFDSAKAAGGSVQAYAWYVFRKTPCTETLLKWI